MKYWALGLFILISGIAGCQFGDDIDAYASGTPIRLISSTGSLDAVDAKQLPLAPLMHAFVLSDDLRLVVRTTFYHSGSLAYPYLTVDAAHRGVLHIDTKAQFTLLSTKCEFLRQFEVEIPSDQWKNLVSLKVYNHDTEQWATGAIELSNADYMTALLRDSNDNVALQDLAGVAHGC